MGAIGVPDDLLAAARERLIRVLGRDAVLLDEDEIAEFRDPYAGAGEAAHRPSFVVQPSTVAEVQHVVRIASDLGVPLWTSSTGRNYGYGGSAPVVSGSVVLSLRRMNRILDIDEGAACALVEPGVTFAGLHAELRARGSALWMSVPDLGWGSIVGNSLEHGYGYAVTGDHASAVCGMEVVLASGEVVRTGLGAVGDGAMWQRHKRAFGPSLDSLFMQSNFGIVTKMGVWLVPRPEAFTTGSVTCDGEDGIVRLVDALRPLVLDGTIQGLPLIVSSPEPAGGRAAPFSDTRALPKERRLSAALPQERWHARIAFYGPAAVVRAREEVVRQRLAGVPGLTIELRDYGGDVRPEDLHPLDLVPAGVPNMLLMDALTRHLGDRFGHLDFSPVIPFDGAAAARHERMVRDVLAAHGLVAGFAWIASSRSLVGACMVLFDVDDEAERTAARLAVGEMVERAAAWGWTEYRGHPMLAERIAATLDFGDRALSRTYAAIKDALDPRGILSPGNHGIWPSRRHRTANDLVGDAVGESPAWTASLSRCRGAP
ncbi:MAG: FAD-binding oxidoreductase [Frankiaceae bacterium]